MIVLDLKNKTFYQQERRKRSHWIGFEKTGGMDLKAGHWKLRRLKGTKMPES
jgi:hypothetical protein